MTPNQLADNAAALLELYASAEEEMLRKVARRLARGVDQPGWAERKYREVQQLQNEIRKELEHLARQSSELRNSLIEDAVGAGGDAFRAEYAALGGFVRSVPASRMNAVVSLTNELGATFDAAHSAILRDVNDSYRSIIGSVVSMQATGTITTQEAIKQALNEFASRGIIGFTDRAGRHWNMDSYAEMAVRTGMMRAMREGYKQDALAHGEELVIISEHEDTCPLCVDWERMVLALTDAAAQNPECDDTLANAEAAGLFHPNCGHSMTVYVPGLSTRNSRKREELGYSREQDLQGYADRQQQRYMERQVRYWKRRQAVSTTPQDERYAKAYVDKWQRSLRAFTGETKLPRKYGREGGRVKLSPEARKLKPIAFNTSVPKQTVTMARRKIGPQGNEVIDKATYNKLTRSFLNSGGVIIRGEEAKEHLENRGYALYVVGGNFAYIRDDATVSDVIEEMYHAKQDRRGDYADLEMREMIWRREIDAYKYLQSVAEKYKIPIEEQKLTEKLLKYYEQLLEDYQQRR